jgi:hypothetical protein
MTRLPILLVFMAGAALAGPTNTATLTWDWMDNNTQGFVYSGSASGVYTASNAVATNFATVSIPQSTTRYFAVTAVNEFGLQSDFSRELMIQNIKPAAPALMKYTVVLK